VNNRLPEGQTPAVREGPQELTPQSVGGGTIAGWFFHGRTTEPKTRKGRAPVPVIRQLAGRLEMHRLRCGNPQSGPIFANLAGRLTTSKQRLMTFGMRWRSWKIGSQSRSKR
jgi:hypothetical protein